MRDTRFVAFIVVLLLFSLISFAQSPPPPPPTPGTGGEDVPPEPPAPGTQQCTPTTCVAQGKNCGTISNGCGGTLSCGTCSSGQSCSSNVCTTTQQQTTSGGSSSSSSGGSSSSSSGSGGIITSPSNQTTTQQTTTQTTQQQSTTQQQTQQQTTPSPTGQPLAPRTTTTVEAETESSNLLLYTGIGIGALLVIGGAVFALMKLKKPAVQSVAQPQVDPAILQVKNYIQQNLAQGYTREQITQVLLQSGYSQQTIDEALKYV